MACLQQLKVIGGKKESKESKISGGKRNNTEILAGKGISCCHQFDQVFQMYTGEIFKNTGF